ncbi:uncharacterized protein METZ01_LOCUS85338, partial [marine metagenome]
MRTSVGEVASRALSASDLASVIDISESLLLTTGIKGAFMLSELIPNPAR